MCNDNFDDLSFFVDCTPLEESKDVGWEPRIVELRVERGLQPPNALQQPHINIDQPPQLEMANEEAPNAAQNGAEQHAQGGGQMDDAAANEAPQGAQPRSTPDDRGTRANGTGQSEPTIAATQVNTVSASPSAQQREPNAADHDEYCVENKAQHEAADLTIGESSANPRPKRRRERKKEWTLPSGWTIDTHLRTMGKTAGYIDMFYISPSGKKLRSRAEVDRYLQNEEKSTPDGGPEENGRKHVRGKIRRK